MFDHLSHAISSSGLMPHGMCYLWQPGLLSLHVISDSLITLAYFSIPFTLLYFVRRRRDLQFNWMFVCFAVFIVACGTTHFMEIVTVWNPVYWLSGSIKAITALASVPTAILLARLIPQALRLPSPSALQREVTERERAEREVRHANEQLEARVAERTAQLEEANARLREEVRQRTKAEESLRANQGLLAAIVDNSEAIIYVKDIEGRYLLTNRRYEQIFHQAPGAMLGRTDYDLFEPRVAEGFRAMDQRALTADRAIIEEEIAPQPDGMYAYLSVKAPLRDASGAVYAIFGISTNISERKRMEEQLRSKLAHLSLLDRTSRAIGERQDLRSIFQVVLHSVEENLHIDLACICMSDGSGKSITVNNIGPRSLEAATALGLREQTQIEVDQNGLARCLRGELVYEPDISPSAFPFVGLMARGGMRSLVYAPLIAESRVFGVMVCARRAIAGFSSDDCEFLRQLSQHVALAAHQTQLYGSLQRAYEDLRQTQKAILQQERLRALGQMASGIAHDINNALTPAALYAQSMLERETSLSRQARDQLEIILRALEDVGHTVARMREFYRPRDSQLAHESVDVNRLIRQVVDLTQARWSDMPQERGVVIDVRTELEEGLPSIHGGESEVRDAITNLVLNAVDSMADGGALTLRSSRDPASNLVVIEVKDTGCGMSEKMKARCLEPFYTTKGERGTGLGLAMVYGMTQRHGAELQIDSEPGVGTTVRLLFPAAKADVATTPAAEPRPIVPRRILLIDDDPLLLRSVRDILEVDGHEVEVAEGGQAGIDAFASAHGSGNQFDVVITDLGMPHVDGRTVAAAIKGASPDTPVVLLTGWGHRLLADRNLPENIDRVLSKPPKLSAFREVLAELA
jgi:PAS domain S-box-containing protein